MSTRFSLVPICAALSIGVSLAAFGCRPHADDVGDAGAETGGGPGAPSPKSSAAAPAAETTRQVATAVARAIGHAIFGGESAGGAPTASTRPVTLSDLP